MFGGSNFETYCGNNYRQKESIARIRSLYGITDNGRLVKPIPLDTELTVKDLNTFLKFALFKKGETLDNAADKNIRSLIIGTNSNNKKEKIDYINAHLAKLSVYHFDGSKMIHDQTVVQPEVAVKPEPQRSKKWLREASKKSVKIRANISTKQTVVTKGNDKFCNNSATFIQQQPHDFDVDHIYDKCNKIPFFTHEYCKQIVDNSLATSNTFVEVSTKNTQTSSDFPNIDSNTFNKDITDYFSGQTGPCNYFVEKSIPEKSRCDFPPIIRMTDLTAQQRLVADYLSPESPYRGLLAYHSLGSGKTLTCIVLLSKYLQREPSRVISVVVKPSLKVNFLTELGKVDDEVLFGEKLTESERERRISRQIDLISYEEFANRLKGQTRWDRSVNKNPISSKGYGSLAMNTKMADSDGFPLLDETLVIIDEAHNLVTPEEAKYPPVNDAYVVMEALKRATNIKILLLTATPIRNEAYEIGLLVNMLRHKSDPKRFPEVYLKRVKIGNVEVNLIDKQGTRKEFNELFLKGEGGEDVSQPINEDVFMDKVKGLVSYYFNENDLSQFPEKIIVEPVRVDMSDEQSNKLMKKVEEDIRKLTKKNVKVTCRNKTDINLCTAARNLSNSLYSRRNDINSNIKKGNQMKFAPKLTKVAEMIEERQTIGKQFAYSFFDATGVYLLSQLLLANGWQIYRVEDMKNNIKNFTPSLVRDRNFPQNGIESYFVSAMQPTKRFMILDTEDSDAEYKKKLKLQFFNMASNSDGKYINLLIVNKNYSEGITLHSVRTVHIAEPPTSNALYRQIIGRAARFCSHKYLAFPTNWNVKIYSYFSVFGKEMKNSYCNTISDAENCNKTALCNFEDNKCSLLPIDLIINKEAKRQSFHTDYFESLLQLSAVDCHIFKNINSLHGICHKDSEVDIKPFTTCFDLGDVDCKKHRKCYWKRGLLSGVCKEKTVNKNECQDYYTEAQECLKDPTCTWKVSDAFTNVKTNSECLNKFPEELVNIPFSIGVSVGEGSFKVYPFYVLTEGNIRKRYNNIVEGLKKNKASELQISLINLLQLLKLPNSTNIIDWESLQNVLKNHHAGNSKEWQRKEILYLLFAIVEEYNTSKYTNTKKSKILSVDFICETCRDFIRLQNQEHFEYLLHIVFDGEHIYIDSRDHPDASITTSNIMSVMEVTKSIRIRNYLLMLNFTLFRGVLTHLDTTCIKLPKFEKNTKITTRIVDLQRNIHEEKGYDDCVQRWEEENLSFPPTKKELVDQTVLTCWSRWKYGKYKIPPAWLSKQNKGYNKCITDHESSVCEDKVECWEKIPMGEGCKGKYPVNPYECSYKAPKFWQKVCLIKN
jgi:superfamily II DNA or RNA helicase